MVKIKKFLNFDEKSEQIDWSDIQGELKDLADQVFIHNNNIDSDYYTTNQPNVKIVSKNERTCIKVGNKSFVYPYRQIGKIHIPCPDKYNWPVTLQETEVFKEFFQKSKDLCRANGFYLDYNYETFGTNHEGSVLYNYIYDEDRGDPRFLAFYPVEIIDTINIGFYGDGSLIIDLDGNYKKYRGRK